MRRLARARTRDGFDHARARQCVRATRVDHLYPRRRAKARPRLKVVVDARTRSMRGDDDDIVVLLHISRASFGRARAQPSARQSLASPSRA